MYRPVALFAVALTALTLAVPGYAPAGEPPAAHAAAQGIPPSLDAHYPPAAAQPVYLFAMLELDSYFSGIVVDLMEDDLSGARDNFDAFRRQYAAVRELVPEWAPYYPASPVEELAAAFDGGDRGRLMQAFGAVGESCHHCHLATMVPVQQRYHWGDFGAVRIADPLSGEVVDFASFKRYLSANLAGIGVNLRQGQLENAKRQFDGFRARFAGLKESCSNCHDRDSRYYVDAEAQALVERLGRALADPATAPETRTALLQDIGRESCSKCHLVHVPAAMAKAAGH